MSNVERKKIKSDRDFIIVRGNYICMLFDLFFIFYGIMGCNWKDVIRWVCWCVVGLINSYVWIFEWYCKISSWNSNDL